jgi:hypothetical protein
MEPRGKFLQMKIAETMIVGPAIHRHCCMKFLAAVKSDNPQMEVEPGFTLICATCGTGLVLSSDKAFSLQEATSTASR